MALQRSDGTPFSFQTNRSVFIQESHIGVNNKMYPEKMVIASDDGIIRYTVMPEEGDTKIFIWVRSNSVFNVLILLILHYTVNYILPIILMNLLSI